jgi:hypothetical protein
MASYGGVPREKWWKIQWFAKDDTAEERKFITKLDLILVPYLLLSYWVKNLDQNNLSAYYLPSLRLHFPPNVFLLTIDLPNRQCLRRRHERRSRLLRQRARSIADNVHHRRCCWADSVFVCFHLCSDVLAGSGHGYLLGNCYAAAVSRAVLCGDGCV